VQELSSFIFVSHLDLLLINILLSPRTIMPPHRFTAANAREYALRSHAPGSARFKRPPAVVIPPTDSAQHQQIADVFAATLSCACNEMLERVRHAKEPREAAQLARALRDLRETYHLATGKPKPGMLKVDPTSQRRRDLPRDVYPLYQSGPTPSEPSESQSSTSTG
jgi:hypothetical protein